MTNCKNCGAPYQPGDRTCRYCGTAWQRADPEEYLVLEDFKPTRPDTRIEQLKAQLEASGERLRLMQSQQRQDAFISKMCEESMIAQNMPAADRIGIVGCAMAMGAMSPLEARRHMGFDGLITGLVAYNHYKKRDR